MTIAGFRQWCKAAFDRIPTHALVVLALILASFASFGLGILVGRDQAPEGPGIRFIERATTTSGLPLSASAAASTPMPEGGEVVASKSGTKYYFPWCGTVKRIKEENKVWFPSREAAEAAGYEPAANCKGL